MSEAKTEHSWSVPLSVDDIPETGSHFELTADAAAREAIAVTAGLRSLPRLAAVFDVTRRGRGLRVIGRVTATVGQLCVISLEPLDNEIDEPVDLLFAPVEAGPEGEGAGKPSRADAEPPEPLVGNAIDLGAIATEFLLLAIDPYPRKQGVEFTAPAAKGGESSPFSVLEALKPGRKAT